MDFTYHEDRPDPASDLKERIRLALDDPTHDFIHVHCKAPDEAAHKGNPNIKSEVIAALDMGLKALVGAVESDNGLLAAVTADHSTPCGSQLIHSGEPVPLVIAGRNIRRDRVSVFDEVSAAGGCLGTLRGKELMLMLLNFADRSILTGQRIGSKERPYFPAAYPPFKVNGS
jgi:2,3-bisphosphoglycerate-independent phosphoglycerate mutase